MTIDKPEVWMIQIPDNPISMYYRGRVEASWEGYNLKYFDAITPKTMGTMQYLQFGKKRGTIEFTPTEKSSLVQSRRVMGKGKKKPYTNHRT